MYDLPRIRGELPELRIDWREEVASTNDIALEAARANEEAPLLVFADRQSAGRGRGGNRWWSHDGSLTFSLLLDGERFGLPTERWPIASLAVGLAVCQTVEQQAEATTVQLKWPNDIYLDGRKLAGVLVETTAKPKRLVIGVGVNVNTRLASAPDEVRERSVSLGDHFARSFDMNTMLVAATTSILARLEQLATAPEDVLPLWRKRCLLTGRQVEIESPQQLIAGECLGVAEDGALLVRDSATVHRIVAGVVRRFT